MLLQPIKERISDRLINDSELSCSQIPSVVDLVLDFRYGHAVAERFLNE